VRTADRPSTVFDLGVYTVADAARFARLDKAIARRWVFGYGPNRCYQELIDPDIPRSSGPAVMSFVALTELRLAAELYRMGLPAIRIRQAAESLRDIAHPFAYQELRLRTDKQNVFVDYADGAAHAVLQVSGLQRGNFVFEKIAEEFFLDVNFSSESRYATSWSPREVDGLVTLDPRIKFGEPVIAETRIPTAAIREQIILGVPTRDIADWYEIDPAQVDAARRFEEAFPPAA